MCAWILKPIIDFALLFKYVHFRINQLLFKNIYIHFKHTHTVNPYIMLQACITLFLLEQILSSSPHPHLFDDLLVKTGSCVLQFASSSLCERVATLKHRKEEMRKKEEKKQQKPSENVTNGKT